MMQANAGVVGMGPMGKNFALNIEDKGYSVAIVNWEKEIVNEVVEENPNKNLIPTHSLEEFVQQIEKSRFILLMVKSGEPTDNTIQELIPLLDKGDLIIDAGNTYYGETIRRTNELKGSGIHFIGMGVSGGEEGAPLGPLLMPSGSKGCL